jgi:hypothetical protein
MRKRGIKVLDRVLETRQVQWLVVSVEECPNEAAEHRIIRGHFLVPHAAWAIPAAFVEPVIVRRTRSRVLFLQRSGIAL